MSKLTKKRKKDQDLFEEYLREIIANDVVASFVVIVWHFLQLMEIFVKV